MATLSEAVIMCPNANSLSAPLGERFGMSPSYQVDQTLCKPTAEKLKLCRYGTLSEVIEHR